MKLADVVNVNQYAYLLLSREFKKNVKQMQTSMRTLETVIVMYRY